MRVSTKYVLTYKFNTILQDICSLQYIQTLKYQITVNVVKLPHMLQHSLSSYHSLFSSTMSTNIYAYVRSLH